MRKPSGSGRVLRAPYKMQHNLYCILYTSCTYVLSSENVKVTEQCTCSAGQRRSEWCVWLAGGVFLQPHPPHSSEVAAPLDDAVCEIQPQMLDAVEGQGS